MRVKVINRFQCYYIYAQRLALVPDDVPLLQVDGWVETIQEQKRLAASSKVQLESKVQEEC